eukprot:m.152619 g.152619  ORF g.152619 m.152619 type:complete len:113 (+) comp38596_c0_seq14:554-892(+)
MTRIRKTKETSGDLLVQSPLQVLGSSIKSASESLHYLKTNNYLNFRGEMVCLETLVDSQIKISSWQFMEAILALSSCKSALLAWNIPPTGYVRGHCFLCAPLYGSLLYRQKG